MPDPFLAQFIMLGIVGAIVAHKYRHPERIKPTNKDKQCGHVNKVAN
tara:strand:+ start:254 stop:394 length:141 start_codon:yes stop_codon:yes gene_type:complete